MSRSILVVDDDSRLSSSLARALTEGDTKVFTAEDGESALAAVAEFHPHIVLSDMKMPGMDGMELLKLLRSRAPDVDVVMMSGFDDLPLIATAMREGAADFLLKPMDLNQLRAVVAKVFESRDIRRDHPDAGRGSAPEVEATRLVGRDPRMVEILKTVGKVAGSKASVVIQGESGTGKEVIARTIHSTSAEAAEPFVAVNCSAVPATLLESELFGHVRGAFTGATSDRKGRFAQAGKGTIFLDEIGDTTLEFQSKLLRVLQEREYSPVGAEHIERTEARVIAATHRNLEDMVRDGQFRGDLYYRLMVVEITVPPLRDRLGDVPQIAEALVERANRRAGGGAKFLAPKALEALMAYDWPGNVRELENCITRAVVMCMGEVVHAHHLLMGAKPASNEAPFPTLQEMEAEHVSRALRSTQGHKSRTADILGISRPRLDRMIAKYGLTTES